jgi:hypothetical protein
MTVSRDFLPLVFHQTIPLGPLIHGLKRLLIENSIRQDIRLRKSQTLNFILLSWGRPGHPCVGFPPKLISSEYRLSKKLLVEIIKSNRNFEFEGRYRNSDKQSKQIFWLISEKNYLKFRHWYWSLLPKSEFRCRNWNSVAELEIRVGIPMSKLKPKSKFWFRMRNQYWNSYCCIEILTTS